MKTIMLRLRVDPEFKAVLQSAVKDGKATSMSELIRTAVERMLAD